MTIFLVENRVFSVAGLADSFYSGSRRVQQKREGNGHQCLFSFHKTGNEYAYYWINTNIPGGNPHDRIAGEVVHFCGICRDGFRTGFFPLGKDAGM